MRFCHCRGPAVQTHSTGLRMHFWMPPKSSTKSFHETAKASQFGTSAGLSQSWSIICTNYQCNKCNSWHAPWFECYSHPNRYRRPSTHHFTHVQTTEGEWTELLTIFTAAEVWGRDNFNEYQKGSRFTLYGDPKPFEPMGNLQNKTFNRLQMTLLEHNFITMNRQNSKLPAELKKLPKELISPTETSDKTPHSRGNLSCEARTKFSKAQ